jgi:hypothetical protein
LTKGRKGDKRETEKNIDEIEEKMNRRKKERISKDGTVATVLLSSQRGLKEHTTQYLRNTQSGHRIYCNGIPTQNNADRPHIATRIV